MKAYIGFCLMLGAVIATGCQSYTVTRTYPDGSSVTISGAALFENRAIGKAEIVGLGTIEGYHADPAADALKATSEGFAAGIVKGMGAVAK